MIASLEVVWSPFALARLEEIRAFVALDKPEAADRLSLRIVTLVEALRIRPCLGRVGAEPGLRELVIGGTPYIVVYQVGRKRILIQTFGMARRNAAYKGKNTTRADSSGLRCYRALAVTGTFTGVSH